MKFKQKIFLLVLIPLIWITVILAVSTIYIASDSKVEDNLEMLKIAVNGFNGDVNAFKDLDIDLTVFEGDTRIESSIEGAVGTKAADEVIQKVLVDGQEYSTKNVDVNGQAYMGYYRPTEGGMLFAGKPKADIAKLERTMCLIISGIALLNILVAVIVLFFIVNKMIKPIIKSSETIEKIAEGDLTCAVETLHGKDEIVSMNNSVSNMVCNLNNVVQNVNTASSDTLSLSAHLHDTTTATLNASNEITRAVENVAQNNTKQAGLVSNITDQLNEATAKSGIILQEIDKIQKHTTNLANDCNDMNNKMKATQNSQETMVHSINNIKDKIDVTNNTINKMSEILATIEEISNQTRLLSLNASIEAARAGEFGRGFSVVADSISNLATSTAEELVSIKEIISTITEDFSECTSYIGVVVQNTNISKKDITDIISSFEKVDEDIRQASNQVDEIKVTIQETNNNMNRIAEDIDILGEISESNAAASEEVNASVEELSSLINGMDNDANFLAEKADTLAESLNSFKF